MIHKQEVRRIRFRQMKILYKQYERFLIPGMLLVGVTVDFITFRTIKVSSAFILLAIYIVIAGATIAFINFYDSARIDRQSAIRYLRLAAPLAVQFTFGALLSASLIFYWFSGALSASWPFLIIIAALMMSNEVLREYYLRPVVQIGVYYFILFSYLSLVMPYLFNSISAWVFVASGFASLAVIYLFVKLLSRLLVEVESRQSRIATVVIAIFLTMNALYFLNLIPPIPLSIREAGVYHGVERSGDGYILSAERYSVLAQIIPGETTHVVEGDSIYVYSAIFAPTDLNATIVHDWQYFDPGEHRWVSYTKSSFKLTGGREEGYRGFSMKTFTIPGRWRVNIETERGQVIGRVKFRIEHVEKQPDTYQLVR
ncbi:MAG: DUF2914 domain-containing protein [bacterium]